MPDAPAPPPTAPASAGPPSDPGEGSGASVTRQIFASLFVVAVCWIFLRFGSFIVSVAISHLWTADEPVAYAYAFIYRQLVMTFLYPSILKIFRPAFIPLYNEVKKNEGTQAAAEFALGTMQLVVLLGLAVFGLIWLSPEFTIRFVKAPLSFLPDGMRLFMVEHFTAIKVVFEAPNLDRPEIAVTVRMMRHMAPGILCLMFAEMYLLLFHAERKFAYPHGAEAVQKISWGIGIVIAAKVLGWEGGAVAATYVAACGLQLAVNLAGMVRTFGWFAGPIRLRTWFRRWGKRAGVLALPLTVGILYARFRDALNLGFQDALGNVKFVSVEYARQLTNLPVQFLGTIVSLVMLPHLSAILHSQGKESHRQTLEGTIETLWLLTIPIVCVTLVMAPELVALVFINTNWGAADFQLFSQGGVAVRMFALGLTFLVIENILLPGLFSIKSMWWPILWGIAASTLQIVCLFGLAFSGLPKESTWFLAGVAFAFPLSRIVKNGVLLLVLRWKTDIFPGLRFGAFLGRICLVTFGTLGAACLARIAGQRVLPAIPTGADTGLLVYKLKIALQLAVPSAVAFGAFVALGVMTGYRPHLEALVRSLLKRGGKKD